MNYESIRIYHLTKLFVDFATLLLAFIFEGSMNAKFIDQCLRQPMRKVNQQYYIIMPFYHSIALQSNEQIDSFLKFPPITESSTTKRVT